METTMKCKLQWHALSVNFWDLDSNETRYDSFFHAVRVKEAEQPYLVIWQFKFLNITFSVWWKSKKHQILDESEFDIIHNDCGKRIENCDCENPEVSPIK